MTEPIPSPRPAPEGDSEARPSLASVIHRLAAAIDRELPPGELAALRRRDLSAAAFWRLTAHHLVPAGYLARHPPRSEWQEKAWAAVLGGMAHMRNLHQSGRRPGYALRDADFSELRFTRLLRARDEALLDALRNTAHYLASKGASVDWTDLAALALFQEGDAAERVRRDLARDFHAQSNTQSQE
jgi:CRISPR system Cascade subunit CasB